MSYIVSQDHICNTIFRYMIYLWCLLYSKKKTLLIWSLWSRLYSSLNFLRKQSCVVNRFVLEKSLELFCLCFSLWQVSHLCLLYDNAHRQFIFILFLRFSIAGENKDGCRNGVWSVDAAMALGTPKKWKKKKNNKKRINYKYWNNKHWLKSFREIFQFLDNCTRRKIVNPIVNLGEYLIKVIIKISQSWWGGVGEGVGGG